MIREQVKRLPFASKAAGVARRGYRRLTAPRPVILMYHRVAEETFDPWNLAVSPDNFADQLQWIARARCVLPLADFARRHREGTLPANAVAITFDDGYACNAVTAAPLLEKLGVAATIFLPAWLILRGGVFWWDELRRIVIDCPKETIDLEGDVIQLGERHQSDHHWPAHANRRNRRQNAFLEIWTRLQPLSERELEIRMDELRAHSSPTEPATSHRLMTPHEARMIASRGIEFGSHSMSHRSLPNLSTSEKAREIAESLAACEAVTGTRPRTFAYPFGDFDSECEALVEQSGFLCACTVEPRSVRRNDRLFSLPRIHVGNWGSSQLRKALDVL